MLLTGSMNKTIKEKGEKKHKRTFFLSLSLKVRLRFKLIFLRKSGIEPDPSAHEAGVPTLAPFPRGYIK